MSLKTERINAQILREVSLILQNEVRDRDLRLCTCLLYTSPSPRD